MTPPRRAVVTGHSSLTLGSERVVLTCVAGDQIQASLPYSFTEANGEQLVSGWRPRFRKR